MAYLNTDEIKSSVWSKMPCKSSGISGTYSVALGHLPPASNPSHVPPEKNAEKKLNFSQICWWTLIQENMFSFNYIID